jgi:hypothetical protein
LLAEHELTLLGHDKLFLLLAALEVVLFLGRKGPSIAREDAAQRRDHAGSTRGREGTGLRWGSVGDANLGNEEGLTRVSDAPNELAQRLEVGVLDLLDTEIRREEVSLVPVVHL